jgi:iron(III) transport system permease protein
MAPARLLLTLLALLVAALALMPLAGLLLGVRAGSGPLLPESTGFLDVVMRSDVAALAGNTLLLAVSVTLLSLSLGTALAVVEQRTRYPFGRILAILALMPLAIPSYLLAGTLREVLGPGGWIGSRLGLSVFTGVGPAILVLTLVCTPYVQILVGAALARMSVAEEEAARCLGAGPLRCFRSVVLPRLRPALALSGMLVVLYVLGDFGAVAVLDCRVLTWRMFQAYETQDLARAAVLGLASLVLLVPFLAFALAIQRRGAGGGVANPREASRVALRPLGAAGAWLLHLPLVGLGLLVPLLALAGWVRSGWAYGESFESVARPLQQTLGLASIGALIVLLLAVVPAWVSARRGGGLGFFLDQATYASGALPGILVATGTFLVALWLQRSTGKEGLYLALRTLGVLLFAGYTTRYLSQGFSGLKSAFLRLDPRLEENARVLGAGPWRRARRITLPAIAPGAAAGWLLLFLVLVKELPITLVLQPIGVQTLSFRIFDRYQEAFLHDAGLAGLVLVAAALTGQLATLRWRRHV